VQLKAHCADLELNGEKVLVVEAKEGIVLKAASPGLKEQATLKAALIAVNPSRQL